MRGRWGREGEVRREGALGEMGHERQRDGYEDRREEAG